MTTTTWKEGIDRIIEQGVTRVYKRELLDLICNELDNREIDYNIFSNSTDWIITIN